MAVKNRANRGQQYRRRGSQAPYVYGNVAVEVEPAYHEQSPERPKKKVSKQVLKNRKQALHMNSAYVIFLTVAAVTAVIVCVNYVKLQSRITDRSKNITAMQKELANLKEENNAKYNAVMDSVNLDEIRERAQNQLGMVYASPEQIVEYDNPATDYVRQLEEIPDDGVLAQSGKRSR
ncbi:hypothetical protein GN277_16120 [Lachnospiraceae bacterium WCA-9-b2]|jgi:cell division protein FtsL|uniref:Cell division protein FtsL n=1 Tax=Sporofaciens musculi TaxID=2681861 RepID=A0A7X3SJW0_9FIRM|nr:hypothetical protein [Sporofaciens musculi]MXP76857.1 hypothetical protein [Sporofaciens musculi]